MRPPPPPKEPSGCIQTIVITKIILQILFIPLVMILSVVVAFIIALYAFSIHPILGGLVLIVMAGVVLALAKWESRRVAREMTDDDH